MRMPARHYDGWPGRAVKYCAVQGLYRHV